jgi:TolB-like protein
VEESNLTVQIAALRRVFESEPGGERWIETLPRRGYRFVGPVEEIKDKQDGSLAATPTERPTAPDKPSIAVLPFENLSGDPEQEYFSDGMAEDLITDISKISGLFVIARNSSFAFKGPAVDIKEIATKLGVGHILEGSVRKMGPKLRVNVQMIDAQSGGHIWAERYDGDLADIFEFQDDIREQIVSALRLRLTASDRALTERKQTDSVAAYDLFLKGRSNFHASRLRTCWRRKGISRRRSRSIPILPMPIAICPTASSMVGFNCTPALTTI